MVERADKEFPEQTQSPVLTDELLTILACPRDRGRLDLREQTLTCRECGSAYAVADGIPSLVIDESAPPDRSG